MFSDLLRDDVFRLETARLWLRWPRMADAQCMVRFAGEKQIAEMTASIPHPYSLSDAEKFIFSCRAGNASGSQIGLVLTRKAKRGEVIGGIGIHETRPDHAIMGYWLAIPFHGQELMSEAAAALINLAYHASDLNEIEANSLVENTASRKVLEKCGFEATGIAQCEHRGKPESLAKYRLDRASWETRANAIAHSSADGGAAA